MPNSNLPLAPDLAQKAFGDDASDELIDTLCAQYNLTRQRIFFCELYMQTMNASKAARIVGYAVPNVQGSRLLAEDNIQAYISVRFKQLRMRTDEILGRLEDIARGDIGDYLKSTRDKATDRPLIIDGKVIDEIYIDLAKLISDGNTARIKSYKRVRGEVSIELHDPIRALELIGKHKRLWADVQANDDRPVKYASELTDDELANIAATNAPAPASGTQGASGGVDTPDVSNAAHNAAHAVTAPAANPLRAELDMLIVAIDNLQKEIDTLTPHTQAMADSTRLFNAYRKRAAQLMAMVRNDSTS